MENIQHNISELQQKKGAQKAPLYLLDSFELLQNDHFIYL